MMPLGRRGFLGSLTLAGLSPLLARAGTDGPLGDWDDADATTLAQWVASGQVSATELLNEAIRRLRAVNPSLNLLSQDHIEMAMATAEGSLPQGAFSGVPFLLKDLGVQLAGTVTSAGSALNANAVATADSTIVRRFKDAGLVIFGKTNTPEFGLALTTEGDFLGDCLNPWNIAHSTGGSSGGSAAAVASGVIPMAHATDGGGSIRVPATFCGLFGLKPTRGLTPGGQGHGYVGRACGDPNRAGQCPDAGIDRRLPTGRTLRTGPGEHWLFCRHPGRSETTAGGAEPDRTRCNPGS